MAGTYRIDGKTYKQLEEEMVARRDEAVRLDNRRREGMTARQLRVAHWVDNLMDRANLNAAMRRDAERRGSIANV